jgi:hypothetical protein
MTDRAAAGMQSPRGGRESMLRCRRLPPTQRHWPLAAITAATALTGILLGPLAIILSRSPFLSSAADLSDMPLVVALTGR